LWSLKGKSGVIPKSINKFVPTNKIPLNKTVKRKRINKLLIGFCLIVKFSLLNILRVGLKEYLKKCFITDIETLNLSFENCKICYKFNYLLLSTKEKW
jgi:hypothetical protein